MKIKPRANKMIWTIIICSLVIIASSIGISFIDGVFSVYEIALPIIVAVLTLLFIVFTYFRTYYEITKNGIVQQTLFKKKFYYFQDIIFINETESKRTKTLLFYGRNGYPTYLSMDDKFVLLYETKNNCKNLLDIADFKKKFPNIRL